MESIVIEMPGVLLYKPGRTDEECKCPYYLIIPKKLDYYHIDENEAIQQGYDNINEYYAQIKENDAIGCAVLINNKFIAQLF